MPSVFSNPSWKDNLYTASFRGIEFSVHSTDTKIGRRNILHQFPLREVAYSEDLGADAAEFTIDGFIIQHRSYNEQGGDEFDYFHARDSLMGALQSEGPGTLIHPFLGELNVIVKGKAIVSESFRQGGMARFQMTFVEVRREAVLNIQSAKLDYITRIDDKAEAAFADMRDSFRDMRTKIKSTIGAFTKGTIATAVQNGFQMLEGGFSGVKGVISSTVSKFRKDITDAISSITNVVTSACSLSDLVLDTIDKPLEMIGIPNPVTKSFLGACSFTERRKAINLPGDGIPKDLGNSMINSFLIIADFGVSITIIQTILVIGFSATEEFNPDANKYGGRLDDITVSNESTAAQAVDRTYVINMFRMAALINATRVAVRTLAASYEDMKDIVTKVSNAMDDLIIKMADESASTTYSDYNISIDNTEFINALEEVRSNFVQVMKEKGASLAKKMDYTIPPAVIPTIVLAYDQYEDILRDEEIFDRNRVATIHPGFLPQGEVIDILDA